MNKQEVKALIESSEQYHYVYILKKPNGVPFYVGKGCGLRVLDHEHEASKTNYNSHKLNTIRKIISESKEVNYEIVNFFDIEQEAFDLEIELISEIGRVDLKTGPLTNLDGGGLGGSGSWSKDTMNKRLATIQEKKDTIPEYTKPWSEGTKKAFEKDPTYKTRISETLKKTYESTDLADRLSKTHIERNKDPKIRKQNSEAQLKAHSEDPTIRERQARSRDKYFQDEEFKSKLGESRKRFNQQNPIQFQENQRKAVEAARTPEARLKNSKSKKEWVINNLDKEVDRIEKIKLTTQSSEYKRLKSIKAKEVLNTPEAKQNISNAQKKRFSDPQQREIARQKSIKSARGKKIIINRCNRLIKEHSLQNINLPDGRCSINHFQQFENNILNIIEENRHG